MGVTVATATITLFLTPFLVKHIGVEAYGAYVLLLSITGVLGFMAYGLNDAVLRQVSLYIGRGDFDGASRTIASGSLLYLCVALGGGAFIYVTAPSIAQVLGLTALDKGGGAFLIRVTALAFAVNFAGGAYSAIPPALQRYDVRALVTLGQLMLQMTGTVVLLMSGVGLRQLVVWIAACAILVQAINMTVARRLLPGLALTPRFDRLATRELLSFSAYSVMTYAFGTAWLYADRFILGAVAGMATVAFFTAPRSLAFRALDFVESSGSALFPRFSAITDSAERSRLFLDATWVLTACAVVVFIPCTALLPAILRLWLGPEFVAHSTLIGQLIFASCTVRGAAVVYQALCNGTGRPRVLTIVTMISASVTTVANVVLIPRFGLRGAGYSYCVSALVAVATILWVWRYVACSPVWAPILKAFAAPAVTGLAILALLLQVPPNAAGWIQLLFWAAAYATTTALTVAGVELVLSGRRRLDQLADRMKTLASGLRRSGTLMRVP